MRVFAAKCFFRCASHIAEFLHRKPFLAGISLQAACGLSAVAIPYPVGVGGGWDLCIFTQWELRAVA